jgi:tyrosyl-tRNA synthetase
MLKYFTFVHPDEIEDIIRKHEEAPHKREAQQILAAEVTRTVHGQSELDKAIKASQVLFGGEIEGLNDAELLDIFNDVPSTELGKDRLDSGIQYVDLLVETGLCKSKGEARRLIRGGGGYINNQGVSAEDIVVTTEHLASESVIILRTGKKKYHLIRFV